MLKDKEIEIKIHTKNISYYKENKIGDIIKINILDLPKGSNILIKCICDNCFIEKKHILL
jgi:hypothetical protein